MPTKRAEHSTLCSSNRFSNNVVKLQHEGRKE